MDPGLALGAHPRDPHRLLTLELVRRATIGLLALGLLIGMANAKAHHEHAELFVDPSSPDSVFSGVLTSFGLVFGAIVVRIATSWVALAMAYPIARLHQGDLGGGPVTGRVALHLDRLGVARAFRELRWTQGVLDAARDRVGPVGARYERAGWLIGWANRIAWVAGVVGVFLFGLTIEM